MAITITSSQAFNAVIGLAVSKAIAEVIDKMFDELQKEIQLDIYAYSTGMSTGSLVEGWRHEAHGLVGRIQFEPALLPIAPSRWIHGSAYDDNWRDVRDLILDIIQGGYRAYNAKTGSPIAPRPFWDKYLAKVDANFDAWVRAALLHQGLPVV